MTHAAGIRRRSVVVRGGPRWPWTDSTKARRALRGQHKIRVATYDHAMAERMQTFVQRQGYFLAKSLHWQEASKAAVGHGESFQGGQISVSAKEPSAPSGDK